MSQIYSSLSLNTLADKMIASIQDKTVWKNPFESPVVVVPDSKVEQWLKFYWMKNGNKENSARTAVLMNLTFLRLETFLFDIIKTASKTKELSLSEDFLRDLILSRLVKEEDGKFYFETFGDAEVNKYLFENPGERKINEIRLYDFAAKMAALFMAYEQTRDGDFSEFCGWQKKLYDEILGKDIIFEHKRYVTLTTRINENKKANGGKLKINFNSAMPVYLFGFSGMGQQYRNLLNEIINDVNLQIYFQVSPYDEGEVKNEVLSKFQKSGCINKKLFKCNEENYPAEYGNNSLLKKMQADISKNVECGNYKEIADDSISVTGAPSVVREVEVLHSKICGLLKSGKAALSDILVLAPDVNEYQVAVSQIFDQNEKENTDYPSVPYVITDYSSDSSLVAEGLSVIFDIMEKGFFSRSDLFKLLHNEIVKQVRGISEEDISSWLTWVKELNVVRDRENCSGNPIKDWEKAKTRLLLSRLTGNRIKVGDEIYLPYSNLASADNAKLYKFIEAIDSLKELEAYAFNKRSEYTTEDIDKIGEILNEWFSFKNEVPEDLVAENLVYKNVLFAIAQKKMVLSICNIKTLSSKCFMFSIVDSGANTSISSGNIFTNGITFTNFKPNRTLSAKYVFMLGMDSKALPGLDREDVLDLRTIDFEKGDDSIPLKNKNAFLCQFMAAEEGLYISYVNKNLQKDEDFYRSSVINDLFRSFAIDLKDSKLKEDKISIDENRSWSELYTPRSIRNKSNYANLTSIVTKTEEKLEVANNALVTPPEKVSCTNLANFLQEPFKFYVENHLSYDDNSSEEENVELEPLSYDNMSRTMFVKDFLKLTLTKGYWEIQDYKDYQNEFEDFLENSVMPGIKKLEELANEVSTYADSISLFNNEFNLFNDTVCSKYIENFNKINQSSKIESAVAEIVKMLDSDKENDGFTTDILSKVEKLKNIVIKDYYNLFYTIDFDSFMNYVIPVLAEKNKKIDDYFGEVALEEIWENTEKAKARIYYNLLNDLYFLPRLKEDFSISVNIENETNDFLLTGIIPYYYEASDFSLCVLNIKSDTYCNSSYIFALAYLAQKENLSQMYEVNMFTCSTGGTCNSAHMKLTPGMAREYLKKIYKEAYCQKNIPAAVPVSMIYKYNIDECKVFEDFENQFFGSYGFCSEWNYFSKRNLFNMKDIGYIPENYKTKWVTESEKMRNLMLHQ